MCTATSCLGQAGEVLRVAHQALREGDQRAPPSRPGAAAASAVVSRTATSTATTSPRNSITASACSQDTERGSNPNRVGCDRVARVRARAGDDGAEGQHDGADAGGDPGQQRDLAAHQRGGGGVALAGALHQQRRQHDDHASRAGSGSATVAGCRWVSTVMPPSTAWATTPSSGRKDSSAQRAALRRPAPDGEDDEDGGDADHGGQRAVAELDQLVDALLLVRHRGERPGHALRPGGAAQPGAGEPDQAAGDDDADLEHEVGDQDRTQQRSGQAVPGRGLDLGAARRWWRRTPIQGRSPLRRSPCRGACGSSRSSGRCATRGRWRPPPRRPARAGGRRRGRPCTKAARRPSPSAPEGSTAARCDRPDRELAAGDDHTAEGEQGHPEQVGDGEDALGAQRAGQQQGERDEGPAAGDREHRAPEEPGPDRVPAEGQARGRR